MEGASPGVGVCRGELVDNILRLGFQGHVAGPVGVVVCYREYLGGLLRVGGFDYCRNGRGVSVCMLPHGWMESGLVGRFMG